jgi:hypothetical protein
MLQQFWKVKFFYKLPHCPRCLHRKSGLDGYTARYIFLQGATLCHFVNTNQLGFLFRLSKKDLPFMSEVAGTTLVTWDGCMDEGTLETPIPKCRLYWSFLFGVVKQFWSETECKNPE